MLFVTGCEEGANPFQAGSATQAATDTAIPAEARIVEQEVEAPEVFQATEPGLWDGRPSLGGVWVAHPDAKTPERVIIRNEANGAFVVGALFLRERENPGPRFQVSSDAAAALKMLAGAPVELSVTALRRKEVKVEPPLVQAAPVSAAPEAAPPVETQSVSEAAAAAPVAETAPADPVAKMAESAIAEATAKAKAGSLPEAPAAQDAAAVAPAATAAPLSAIETSPIEQQAPSSSLDKPFIQIGIFSVEENANRAAESLRKSGVVPVIRASTLNGKSYWRVLAGPTTNRADLQALLKKVKGLGYVDAYAVSG